MPEMRVSHVIIVLVVLAPIGTPLLICFGVFAIPSLNLFGWKTPELTKKSLTQAVDQGVAAASGYAAAKTPTEAMDFFHKAIQERNYVIAANYTTKEYGEQLKRETRATALGRHADSIRSFANEKGFMNDRLRYTLNSFDPFPRNFKPGPAPVVAGNKASGSFVWEPVKYDSANLAPLISDPPFKDMDVRMFQTLYRQPFGVITAETKIDLVKEGDEWKLVIPAPPLFVENVTYYMGRSKAYDTALNGFVTEMNRLRNVTKSEFEQEVMKVLRESK